MTFWKGKTLAMENKSVVAKGWDWRKGVTTKSGRRGFGGKWDRFDPDGVGLPKSIRC